MKESKERFYCESCGKKLVGLYRDTDDIVKPKPNLKLFSSKYPLCDRCWIASTTEGKRHNSKRVKKTYHRQNPVRVKLRLAALQAYALAKGARVEKKRLECANLYSIYNNRFKTPVLLFSSTLLTEIRDWLVYPELRKELEQKQESKNNG
jgi:hypothetical protein